MKRAVTTKPGREPDHRPQSQGSHITGLAKDAARCYPKSLKQAARLLEADFSVPVQKDVRYILSKVEQTLHYTEQQVLEHLGKAEEHYQAALQAPDDEARPGSRQGTPPTHHWRTSHQFHSWYGCLCNVLEELVDWRSGDIRDQEINQRQELRGRYRKGALIPQIPRR